MVCHAIPMLLAMEYASLPLVPLSIITPQAFSEFQLEIIQILRRAVISYMVTSGGSDTLPPRLSSSPMYLSDSQLVDTVLSFNPPVSSPNLYSETYFVSEFCSLTLIASVLGTNMSSASFQTILYQKQAIPQSVQRLHAFLNHQRFTGRWDSMPELQKHYNDICRPLLPTWENLFNNARATNVERLVDQAVNAGTMFCLENISCFANLEFVGTLAIATSW